MLNWFDIFPPELSTFLIAMCPVFELRASIPIGLSIYHQSVLFTYILSVLGNLVVVPFVLFTLGPISKFLSSHSRWIRNFFAWWFFKTQHKFAGKYAKYGAAALVLFVAIPLPGTGAWTGALAAWLFRIPIKHSLPLIAVGVLLAGVLVTLASLGIFKIL